MPSLEVFANCASAVTSGTAGTSAPASGTQETWAMGTGYLTFPVASTSTNPQTYFYIRDPDDDTNEIVQVTAGGASGSSWTVLRGVGGTTPVAHATGATWVQVCSHLTLQSFKQKVNTTTTAVTLVSSTTETILATYQPLASEIAAGSSWEVSAFGPMLTASTAPALTLTLRWGGLSGTSLVSFVTGTSATALAASMASGSSFDINGTVTLIDATHAVANLNMWTQKTTAGTTSVGSSQASVAITGSGPIVLTAKWGTSSASNSLTALAPRIYQAA